MKSRFAVLAALLILVLTACSLADDITPPPGYQAPTAAPALSISLPTTAPDLAAGGALYVVECAPCHGERGLGDGSMAAQLQNPPTALAAPEISRSATTAGWYAIITEGRMDKFMPPFSRKLTDEQRWNVSAYALALGISADEMQAGKTIFEANCVQCHGADGQANPQVNFSDPARLATLSLNDLAAVVNAGRKTMPPFQGRLTGPEIFSAVAYARSFALGVAPLTTAPAAAVAATPAAETTPAAEAPAGEATPAETAGEIRGQVLNGSGAALPTGLEAVLHTFEHNTATQEFTETETLTAPVDAKGVYTFSNLKMSETSAFFVSIDFGDVTYESDPAIPAQDGLTSYDLPITIYETTSATDTLVVQQAHILLDYSKPDIVQVVEFLIITNTGTQTVAAAEPGGAVVEIALPAGYANLQFEIGALGERYLQTANGFADTLPVTPGAEQYQIVFAFDLPKPKAGLLGSSSFEFSQPQNLAAEAVSILLPEGLTLKAEGFTGGETQEMGEGVRYQVYQRSQLPAGSILTLSATGKPTASAAQPAAETNSLQNNLVYVVGALGVVLILVGGWLYWRDRQQANAADEDIEDETEAETPEATDDLLDAIVALDDQFKAGKIPETAYQERRAELKAKLKARL